MDLTPSLPNAMSTTESGITATIVRERGRLKAFIRRRVADPGEAEDILQDVFFELVQAYRLPEPIEQVGAWLFRVARNRIIDRFRKKREEPLPADDDPEDGLGWLDDSFSSESGRPESAYSRKALLVAFQHALDELPDNQREVFLAHEFDGRSFKDLATDTGINVNTLLSRKRAAVLHLRSRLRPLHDEFNR
ncbi:RNA polymerase subunit sigma-24 [Rhizobacter sp. Root1221]|nr:RNA polymerase subunit sigma-24 [Rhizobacter sp. Root1221]